MVIEQARTFLAIATLTPARRRFLPHARSVVRTVEPARHDTGLPGRYRASGWCRGPRCPVEGISVRLAWHAAGAGQRRCCFPPVCMAQSFLDDARLFRVNEEPGFLHTACMVLPREADSEVLHPAPRGLREQAAEVQAEVPV